MAGPPPAPTPPAAPAAPGGPAPALGGPQPQAAPRPQTAPVAPPPAAAIKTTRVFLGNDTATELMQTLSRLPAIRALGAVGREKLAEFGLTSPATTLTLRGGGATRTFVVGGRTYGNNDLYLLDQSDGHVYVVRPAPVQDLLNAEFRLADRQLHRFELADIDRVVIRASEGEQTLRQHEARVPGKAFWTVASAADQSRGKELVGNWINKLGRLQVLDYVGPDEPTDGQKERLRVDYFDGRKRVGFIEVLQRALLVPGTVAGLPGGSYEYFARSEHTRRLIKLSRPLVEDLERDLAAVIREK